MGITIQKSKGRGCTGFVSRWLDLISKETQLPGPKVKTVFQSFSLWPCNFSVQLQDNSQSFSIVVFHHSSRSRVSQPLGSAGISRPSAIAHAILFHFLKDIDYVFLVSVSLHFDVRHVQHPPFIVSWRDVVPVCCNIEVVVLLSIFDGVLGEGQSCLPRV